MTEKLTFNLTEAAQLLGIDRKTMTALVHRGDSPAFRVGTRWLVSRSGLEAWIASAAASGAEYGGVRQ